MTDIASQGSIDGNLYVYTNTAGVVHALNAKNGKTLWTYTTGNKIFSAPFITPKLVIVSSCDGFIYALDRKQGTVRWKYNTNYPIVACPVVTEGTVYIGSSNGKFYSLKLTDGTLNWTCNGLQGYIESRPAVDKERVYRHLGSDVLCHRPQEWGENLGVRHQTRQIFLTGCLLAGSTAVYAARKDE